jgi:hypothetical protein
MRIRAHETGLIQALRHGIQGCISSGIALPGIQVPLAEEVFLGQLVDSIRRVKYVTTIALPRRGIHPSRADATSPMFDPLDAAIIHLRNGNVEEACWLVFLFVHFGRHSVSGWRYVQEVYGALGNGLGWSWARTSANPQSFKDWLRESEGLLTRGTRRGFGNHRKYISMSADKPAGTGAAVSSYVQWVKNSGSHQVLFAGALATIGGVPEKAFDQLYRSMCVVKSFGRTAKFDYLTMIAKLGIANIKPGSAYIPGSTGPEKGAREMFQVAGEPRLHVAELDQKLVELARHLKVGMQEMEDSICNWQKSPKKYKYFGG